MRQILSKKTVSWSAAAMLGAMAIALSAMAPPAPRAEAQDADAHRTGDACGCGDRVRAVILLENTRQRSDDGEEKIIPQVSIAAERPFSLQIPMIVTAAAGTEKPVTVSVDEGDGRWRRYADEPDGNFHLDGISPTSLGGAGRYDFDRGALGRGDPCICSYVFANVTFHPLPHDPTLGANQTLLGIYEAEIEILRYAAVVEISFSGPGVSEKIGPVLERPGHKIIFKMVSPKVAEGVDRVEVDSILEVGPDLVTEYEHAGDGSSLRPVDRSDPRRTGPPGNPERPADPERGDPKRREAPARRRPFASPPIVRTVGTPSAPSSTSPCDLDPYTIDGEGADGDAPALSGGGTGTTDRPWTSGGDAGTPEDGSTSTPPDERLGPPGTGERGDPTRRGEPTVVPGDPADGSFPEPPILRTTTTSSRPCDLEPYTIGGDAEGGDAPASPAGGSGTTDRPGSPTDGGSPGDAPETGTPATPNDRGDPTGDPTRGRAPTDRSDAPVGQPGGPFPEPPILRTTATPTSSRPCDLDPYTIGGGGGDGDTPALPTGGLDPATTNGGSPESPPSDNPEPTDGDGQPGTDKPSGTLTPPPDNPPDGIRGARKFFPEPPIRRSGRPDGEQAKVNPC